MVTCPILLEDRFQSNLCSQSTQWTLCSGFGTELISSGIIEIHSYEKTPLETQLFLKGSDWLCKVVELSMQYCGTLLSDSFETTPTLEVDTFSELVF